ncbi:MAG: hypothetical protein IPM92_05405 [Saprospiraceae bacterium]|nr:hypothetical protein [Saprospiraceae bacterium]
MQEDQDIAIGQHSFSMYFDGGNLDPNVLLGSQHRTNYNFIKGQDSKKWVSGVKAATDITLEDVFQGIDFRFYSANHGNLNLIGL